MAEAVRSLPRPQEIARHNLQSSAWLDDGRKLRCGGTDRIEDIFRLAYPTGTQPGAEGQFATWCLMVLGREPVPGDVLEILPYEKMLAAAAKATAEQASTGKALVEDGVTLTGHAVLRKKQHADEKSRANPMLGALGSQPAPACVGRGRLKISSPRKHQSPDYDRLGKVLGQDRAAVDRGARARDRVLGHLATAGLPVEPTVESVSEALQLRPVELHPLVELGVNVAGNTVDTALGDLADAAIASNGIARETLETFDGVPANVPAGELLRELTAPRKSPGDRLLDSTKLVAQAVVGVMPGAFLVDDIVANAERLLSDRGSTAPREALDALVTWLRRHLDSVLVDMGGAPTAWVERQGNVLFNPELTLGMLRGVTREQFEGAVKRALTDRVPPVTHAELIAEALAKNVRQSAGSRFHNRVYEVARDGISNALASLRRAIDPRRIAALTRNLAALKGAARKIMFERLDLDPPDNPPAETVAKTLQAGIDELSGLEEELTRLWLVRGPDWLLGKVPWAAVAVAQEAGIELEGELFAVDLFRSGSLVQDGVDGYIGFSRFLHEYYETVGNLAGAMASAGATGIFTHSAANFAFDVALSSAPDIVTCIATVAESRPTSASKPAVATK